MKKILITGADSYIGTSLEQWLKTEPEQYQLSTVDMKDGSWREMSFKGVDVVFHVAGIVHLKSNAKMKDLYYQVNRDLAVETAKKAKADGVRQFIFMSSMSVYGDCSRSKENKIITRATRPEPSSDYGSSKLQAEEGISPLQSAEFHVVMLRPPMIYGKNCKGNYPRLSRLAQKAPVFPDLENQRSMLHIDNFCEFIRVVMDQNDSGLFFPQNAEYVRTSEMVRLIAEAHGRKLKLTKAFNGMLRRLTDKVGTIDKVFGDLVYEKSMSEYPVDYRVRSFAESIRRTEETG